MSKQIDLTVPLSDEDREWLLARGRDADVALADRLASGEPLVAEDAGAASAPEDSSAPGEDAPTDQYDEWSKDALQSELEDRGLPSRGTKAELIEVLRNSDAEVNADG